MENATKALIIAAAILIAIVLISLGVFVLGQGTTMVKDNSDMSDVEISTYNSKFEAYFGTNVSGTRVKQLISVVNQHDKANSSDTSRTVEITGVTGLGSAGAYDASKISSGNAYSVEVDPATGYTSGGLIKTITITAK